MDGQNLSSDIRPEEIPDGFTTAGPNSATTQGSENGSIAQKKDAQRQAALEQVLTPDALARLGTIKLVKPDRASAVEGLIVSMAMSGKLPGRINEGKLIEMLEGIGAKQQQTRSTINIQRKQYAFDSDSGSDFDDDDLL
mmetsp:Transcript_19117/g.18363  ORF Transcript_19117/g.18363 Transcript_19117/m.18363 type:complete len:139 (-) Transcript_19117:165-581(-)|eukprot:CAMPEP_0197834764 /NCGR_PEP_ID=MMETSP1437-20131217/23620_1 /TAXON_ID=49252 ORGANISM="Eucampia antarctica, Strain CCMP1452" /NCGR_SAMPLE_ID=MMETSP1437 /ASSEMBLY_ACC=CAM_ASM_001096 /LENGTH=138 /DNA_ID=CAMNT_0043439717 /DNA_START=101 /DNA_END=517 /DNA_ORIENTATION=-